MNDIFTNMVIPELGDGDFQQSFHDFCTAIKQNIERLMSVQYTKGEPGNSVITEPMEIGYNNGVLTPASAMFLSTIFGVAIPAGTTRADVCDIIEEHAPSITTQDETFKAIPALMNEDAEPIQISINIDKVTGEAYLASPFIFTDGRIEGLNQIVHGGDLAAYNTFHDFSTAVYGKATYDHNDTNQDKDIPLTWDWEFENVAIIPKLYFDENIKEFCWEVNGQQTGITAQGIKGDTGKSPDMIIATGNKNGNIIRIDQIQTVDDYGTCSWVSPDDDYIKSGDLALVFYTSPDSNVNYDSAFVGKVYVDNTATPYYVHTGYPNEVHPDIFESIKAHDLWNLMMSINSNNVGSPRGYILPASSTTPATEPDENSHMIYSGKGNNENDGTGFGKLHIAPVKTNDTHMSQELNPTADHTGEMQVDYNVDIKGKSIVRHDSTIQGNMSIQGSILGNLDVQGSITARNVTISGRKLDNYIESPKLACLSKIKDTTYILNRDYTNSSSEHSFKYTLVIAGTLELNIGALSWFNWGNPSNPTNPGDCWLAPQRAISGYGPNWAQGVSITYGDEYEHAFENDCAQGVNFNLTESNKRSKLYNVVKYNIPFSISKELEVDVPNVGSDADNLFGFNEFNALQTYWDHAPSTKIINSPADKYGSLSGINLRFLIDGFNYKNGNKHYGCKHVVLNNDIDESPIAYAISGHSDDLVAGINTSTSIDESSTRRSILSSGNDPQEVLATQGAAYRLTQNPGVVWSNGTGDSRYGTPLDPSEYTISGELYYAPLGKTLNYYFDMFTRIFENDATSWVMESSSTTNRPCSCTGITYNINLNVTPVGFVKAVNGDYTYYSPIWNNFNVRNEVSNSIGNIKNSKEFAAEHASSIIKEIKVAVLNAFINHSYHQTLQSTSINGPKGNIITGQDINSNYNLGVFSTLFDNSNSLYSPVWNTEDGQELNTSCFDITKSLVMVENNVKVCPNNVKDGTWIVQGHNIPENNEYGWVADTPVPYIVIPHSGFISTQGVGYNSNNEYFVLVGCGNIKPYSQNETQGTPITFNGLLTYPYTPCVITRSSDNKIPSMRDLYNDTKYQNDSTQGRHYIRTGRLMGVSEGDIIGIATRISTSSSDMPDIPVPSDHDSEIVLPD